MEEKPVEQPRREWSPRMAFIPRERRVDEKHSAFRTHDGDVYVRTVESGVVRRPRPKAKGKTARRAEKQARRTAKRSMVPA